MGDQNLVPGSRLGPDPATILTGIRAIQLHLKHKISDYVMKFLTIPGVASMTIKSLYRTKFSSHGRYGVQPSQLTEFATFLKFVYKHYNPMFQDHFVSLGSKYKP